MYKFLLCMVLLDAASLALASEYPPFVRDSMSLEAAGPVPPALREFVSADVWAGVRAYTPSAAEVSAFTAHLVDDSDPDEVCDFLFGSFQGTNAKQLILLLRPGRFCTELVVVSRLGAEFQLATLDGAAWLASLKYVLQDLAGRGTPELVVAMQDTDYEGAAAGFAVWDKVFWWNGEAYVDASSSFPQIYRDRLRDLDAEIAKLEAEHAYAAESVTNEGDTNLYFERDKLRRYLGIDAHAGFARAERWAGSDSAKSRRMAIRVFEELGDDASATRLRQLASDSDKSVRSEAADALAKVQAAKSRSRN